MTEQKLPPDKLIWFLHERAKELNCLYRVEELLNQPDARIEDVCRGIIEAIPPGWQYPETCRARINLGQRVFQSDGYLDTPWEQHADIRVLDQVVGKVSVVYLEKRPDAPHGHFLDEEGKLVGTIAERLGNFITYQKMKYVVSEYRTAAQELTEHKKAEWRVVLDLLRQTDRGLYVRICHKMLNHLCWNGVIEAKQLQRHYNPAWGMAEDVDVREANQPFEKVPAVPGNDSFCEKTFRIANEHLNPTEVLDLIEKWIQEDKLGFLTKSLINPGADLAEVADAIHRYQRVAPEGIQIPQPTRKGVLVALIRRFFSENLDFINMAKNHIEVADIFDLLQNVIYLPESPGKLGGKSAGLFLASQILKHHPQENPGPGQLKIPRTWYIAADTIYKFIYYNNFEEVVEQKYKDIDVVRLEYPNVVQTFKNAHFPPELAAALSQVLDDLKDTPIIVRSSSLLEDRTGAAFSGKYKSLFLANQGDKEDRLAALLDAVAEVYASTFGPDPIQYRAERGLLDFHEEMGIMIQQVVGTRVGKYFFPTYAGVAFGRNEFRWSPRIRREDGLVRLVPGLGTRAVDRVADDFPVLMSPGQPGLRVNATVEEMVRYSPRMMDVINLETNSFETVRVADLLREVGGEVPGLGSIVSVVEGDHLRRVSKVHFDAGRDEVAVTFDGLISQTGFVQRIKYLLRTLEEKTGLPVDIEFASDGKDFYLLQCRSQSAVDDSAPAPIPQDVPDSRVIFTANRFVCNGRVPDITHIVYVDPQRYDEISDRGTLLAVGRAVSQLNALLPKRQFILMGPGRWGSRGDIKLGVSVTYSDINNTAVLVEVARRKGNYQPEPSFGTHFFQDLVEARIRYLPLYPDDPGVVLNTRFLRGGASVFVDLVPDMARLSDVVRVIDVPSVAEGRVLRVLLNADLDQAMGMLAPPRTETRAAGATRAAGPESSSESYWRWRLRMAEHMASRLDPVRFGVRGLYVFGSTKNATAGPGSDIDILVHFGGTPEQHDLLRAWLEGWSESLAKMNYLQTGYPSEGLLDIHIVTDADIARKDSFAIKIGAVTDAARPLAMMTPE